MDQSEDQPGKEIKWDPNLIGVSDRKDLIHIKVFITSELEGYSGPVSCGDVPRLLQLSRV